MSNKMRDAVLGTMWVELVHTLLKQGLQVEYACTQADKVIEAFEKRYLKPEEPGKGEN